MNSRSLGQPRLESWKQIANYLNRHVRTVQRWAEAEGLPVHRHNPGRNVYAVKSDLDEWLKKRDSRYAMYVQILDSQEERSCWLDTVAATLSLSSPSAKGDLLDGWKQIADYLNCHVRTAQRWEKERGLPIHRHLHAQLGTVFALKSEIDGWLTRDISHRASLGVLPLWDGRRDLLTPVQAKHRSSVRSVNPKLRCLHAEARYFWNKRTEKALKKALDLHNEAIAYDPQWVPACVGIADCWNLLGAFDFAYLSPSVAFPRARVFATKALELDPTSAAAYASLGLVKMYYDWDWQGAEYYFNLSLDLAPDYASAHHWYAMSLALQGRYRQAIGEIRCACQLDPTSLIICSSLGTHLSLAGSHAVAVKQFEKVLEMDRCFAHAREQLGLVYMRMGMFDRAIVEFQELQDLHGDCARLAALIACAYALAGIESRSAEMLDRVREFSKSQYVSPYLFAEIYSSLHEKAGTLKWLYRCYKERAVGCLALKVDPAFREWRSDADFKELLRRIGLG